MGPLEKLRLSEVMDEISLQSSSLESDAQLVKVDETFERKLPDVNQFKKVKIQIIFPLPG